MQDVFSAVWRACDTFRGLVDPSMYKEYVLTMLFLKYLSDLHRGRVAELQQKYAADPATQAERVQRALRHERFQVPEVSTFGYLFDRRKADNIGELINVAFQQLEDANRAHLEGVFRSIDFNSEAQLGQVRDRNRRLKLLLEDFAAIDLEPSHLESNDVIGDVYEYLIYRFAAGAGKKAGEFYTPSAVSSLLARLVDPQPGDRICDPACGSGSLLIRVGKQVGSRNFSLYGQEVNGSTYALARQNMVLHDMDDAQIKWGDTLNNPQLLEDDKLMRFNVVVANPPFSLDKWGAESASKDRYSRFWRGVPPKSKGDFAFLSHMIETTYPTDGRVGVILPHGVLFRASSEGAIRKQLLKEGLVEAIIGLPADLFYGTNIATAIILLRRNRTTSDVLFIDASTLYKETRNKNVLLLEHANRIVAAVQAFRAAPEAEAGVIEQGFAYRASLERIEEESYNLNIARYVDTFKAEAPIDIAAVQKRLQQTEDELTQVRAKMREFLNLIKE
ncbi:type I restriction-modification system subunit M [Hymenobacter sediminis]|nr:type I restriction-modification system subunit M [Hymenobacter sediminis]